MDLKNEFYEYKKIYDSYSDKLNEKIRSIDDIKKKLIEKDKEDIQAQLDTEEKQAILDDYMLEIYMVSLLQNDMKSLSHKLLYIHEASLRNNVDLNLAEDASRFIHNLSMNEANTFVIDGGDLRLKNEDIEKAIRANNKRPELRAMYIDAVRKDKDYVA